MAEEYQKHSAHLNWTEEPDTSGYGDSDVIESNICLETVPYCYIIYKGNFKKKIQTNIGSIACSIFCSVHQ